MNVSVTRADNWKKAPGTCDQMGNTAPRFRWSRIERVAINCCAYHLGYDDDRMGRKRDWPHMAALYQVFTKLFPWFEAYYNASQRLRAEEIGYPVGKLEPLDPGDVQGRLHYCYTLPGSRVYSPHSRLYGISREHHCSIEQSKPGGRGETWAKYSEIIFRRIREGRPITRAEDDAWSGK